MFGYERSELLGGPIEQLLPEASREKHLGYRGDYMAHPRVRPMGIGVELAGRRKDGDGVPG